MRKLLSITAAIASVFAMGAAQADVLLVDSFNAPIGGQTGSDTSLDSTYSTLYTSALTGQIATARTVSQNLSANPLSVANSVSVGGAGGALIIDHGASANSLVKVDWTIAPFTIAPASSAITFAVIFSNVGTPAQDINLAFTFTGPGGNFTSLINGVPSLVNTSDSFALTAAQATAFAGGGTLSMVVSGTAGYDFVVDEFSITVPEPTSMALVGLALLGAGVASRRRKA